MENRGNKNKSKDKRVKKHKIKRKSVSRDCNIKRMKNNRGKIEIR